MMATITVTGRRRDSWTRFILRAKLMSPFPRAVTLMSAQHNFLVHFLYLFPKHRQDFSAERSEPVILAGTLACFWIRFAFEPSQAFHPLKERIERAGAEFVTVMPEFAEHPLAMNRPLACVMKDVHLPE